MSIVISLSPEVEAQLREKAAQQGQDVSIVAAELITPTLKCQLSIQLQQYLHLVLVVLREKAAQQGQDVSIVAAELITDILKWELQDSEEAIAGVQHGLDDFEAGRSRSFHEFAKEQRRKYNLPTDS